MRSSTRAWRPWSARAVAAVMLVTGAVVVSGPPARATTVRPQAATTVVTGDFNKDGRTDLAQVGGATSQHLLPIATSQGNGSFTPVNASVGDFDGWASVAGVRVTTADFNGDGRADIALTPGPNTPWWSTMPVAFSNGDGTFRITNSPQSDFANWAQVAGAKVLDGDFNHDGRADLALVGGAGWTTVPVALSNGDGTFRVVNGGVGDFAGWDQVAGSTAVAGDFDGDGRTDIALAPGPNVPWWFTMPVAFSNGDGTFRITNSPQSDFAAWAQAPGVKAIAGDFNADGRTDWALAPEPGTPSWFTMPVAFSNGDGTFRVTDPVAALAKPASDLSIVVPPEAAPVPNQPGIWAPVPGLSTAVTTAAGANLAATVSAEIYATNTVWLRVLVDGQVTMPTDVVYRLPGPEFDGTRSFTFGREGLSAGRHIVQVEWFSNAGQPARIRDRSLSVNSEAAGDGRVAHVAAESDWIVKPASATWDDVPSLTKTVNLAATSNLKITFSGLTTSGGGRFFARAVIDGQPTEDVLFEDAGVVGGSRSYVFLRNGVGAGNHTVTVQWHAEGGNIMLADRALTVFAAPESTARGSLVGTVFQGGPQAITSAGWIDLSNASTSFTTYAPSSDVDVTIGMEHQANHDRTFLRALLDGVPVGQADIEMSTNVTRWHAQTYSFAGKNVLPGPHTVRIQIAVDSGATALIGDRTLSVTTKRRNGTDFAQPYNSLAPRVGTVPVVAICFDPRRPGVPAPSAAYLRGIHDGSDGGTNSQAWYRENTGNQFGMGTPTYIGCDDSGWLSPPAGRTGTWYWDTSNFPLMWHDALVAADPFVNFKAFDRNGDNRLDGSELVIEIIRPQNSGAGFNVGASANLDGVDMTATVLDLYLSSSTDKFSRLTNVGLISHEGAHDILGAVDMYPGDKNGANALRPGYYSVMDSHFNANHFDAFHKLKSGFVTPNVIEANGWSTHTVTLAAVETQREVTIVYDPARGDREYFIVENRWGGTGNANYDGTLPAQGVVIWDIVQDPTLMNQFPPPYTGQLPVSGDWGRLVIRRIAVLNASGQTKDLTYADGSPAHFRITTRSGPQEFVNTDIARV